MLYRRVTLSALDSPWKPGRAGIRVLETGGQFVYSTGVQGGDHGPGVSAVKMTAIEILGCLFGGEMGGAGGVKGCGPTTPRFLN